MVNSDIEIRRQLATRNATWFWLALIPTYMLALSLLFIFYEKYHAWKKENVVVGFQFDDSQEIKQIIAQTKFRGSWVSEISNDKKDSRKYRQIDPKNVSI